MDYPLTTLKTTGPDRRNQSGQFLPAFSVILSLLIPVVAIGQELTPETNASPFSAHLSLGMNGFALTDARNFYDGLLEIYRTNGIPIPTQREFPVNVIFGASVSYSLPKFADVGLGSRYTWTRAFSSYEDYAGTADVNGKVSMLTLEGIIQKDLAPENITGVYVGARGGLAFGWSKYSQSIVFNNNPGQNTEILLSASGMGFTAEGFVGVRRRMESIVLGLSAGYRYANISKMDGDITVNGLPAGSGTLQLKHDMSGFILMAHVDFAL